MPPVGNTSRYRPRSSLTVWVLSLGECLQGGVGECHFFPSDVQVEDGSGQNRYLDIKPDGFRCASVGLDRKRPVSMRVSRVFVVLDGPRWMSGLFARPESARLPAPARGCRATALRTACRPRRSARRRLRRGAHGRSPRRRRARGRCRRAATRRRAETP